LTVKALAENQLDELRSLLKPEQVSQNPSELMTHARDESPHGEFPPDVICYPASTQDVVNIVKFCNERKVPVTPWGAGTSLEANPVAVHGGVSLDVSKMDAILDIRPADFQVTVQPGVVLQHLNDKLAKHGLFFPPDPGAPCTIGGMVANNAAGIQAVKYGPTKNYGLQMEVVLPSGGVIRCGTRAMRTSSAAKRARAFVEAVSSTVVSIGAPSGTRAPLPGTPGVAPATRKPLCVCRRWASSL